MGRWEPDARGRLAKAALELYSRQGLDRTTAAEIAQAAGMHERSFFRLFPDKQDVLFYGMDLAREQLAQDVNDARAGLSAWKAVALALEQRCAIMQEGAAHARLVHEVIAASAELRERQYAKHVELAEAIADALTRRGIESRAAMLVARVAMTAFELAEDRWAKTVVVDLPGLFRAALGDIAEEIGRPQFSTPGGASTLAQQ